MNKRKEKDELLKYVEKIRDDDGNAVVDVCLSDEVAIYDPLSLKGAKDLNGDIYDYIEKQTNVIPANVPLRIRMHGDFSEKEQGEIKQIMHQHYVMKTFDISWDLVANFKKMALMAIFGVIVLAIYLYLAITAKHVFVTEILSIIGSFSLWEAADAFLVERPRLRRESRNNEQNLNAKIEFIGSQQEVPAPDPIPTPQIEEDKNNE